MKRNILLHRLSFGMSLIAFVYVAGLFLFGTTPADAYVTSGRRVNNRVIWNSSFKLDQSTPPFPASTRRDITNAAYQWDDVNTGANFNADEAYSGYDAYVRPLNFQNAGYDPNMPSTTIATFSGGKISFSDTYLNNNGWQWNNNTCKVDSTLKKADTRVVLTHELGHWIRLMHDPNHKEAVMWPDGRCKLTTVADDDNGVISLYGRR